MQNLGYSRYSLLNGASPMQTSFSTNLRTTFSAKKVRKYWKKKSKHNYTRDLLAYSVYPPCPKPLSIEIQDTKKFFTFLTALLHCCTLPSIHAMVGPVHEFSLHGKCLLSSSLSRACSRPFHIPLPPSTGTTNKQTKTHKKPPTQPNPLLSLHGQIPCCHGYHSKFSCGTRNEKKKKPTHNELP